MDKTTSGWEAYANQLEQDIKEVEEKLSKQKQEIRDLCRQRLENAPDADLQKQLDHVRQEVVTNRGLYERHLHQMQQELATAQRNMDATAQQMTDLEKAHKAAHQEIKDLRTQLAERTRQLQQAASAPLTIPGANENAKLLNHSDKKSNWVHDDSDDEELNYPKPPTKKMRRAHRSSNLDDNFRGPMPQGKMKHVKTSMPKRTAPPMFTATQQAEASSPRNTARSDLGTTSHSTDSRSDEDQGRPRRKQKTPTSTAETEFPIRESLHKNMTETDRSPEALSVSASSPSSSQTIGGATSVSDDKDKTKPSPSKKRKRAAGASSLPSTGHRRSYEQQMRDELSDLTITAKGFEEPDTPRKKGPDSYEEDFDEDNSEDESYDASLDFRFTAVCKYDEHGEVAEGYPSIDLNDCVPALWDRIKEEEDRWQETFGEFWMWEFIKPGKKAAGPVCVSKKCARKPTKWGHGSEKEEVGKYACVDCAKAGRPCFTYVSSGGGRSGRKGEFRLLPLRDSDRTKEVAKGEETHYWINDERKASRGDDMEF